MKMNKITADVLNATSSRLGIALQFEQITPESAEQQLKNNPALLAEYGLSQKMSGDASDELILDGKGRKFIDTLVARIRADRWKWYMGVLSRCENGAIVDGVTRLLAIHKAEKPVWALVYGDADPNDFFEFDDPASAREPKDIFWNLGIPSEISGVLSHIVPKAAGSVTEDGAHVNIIRDKWYSYFLAHKDAFLEAAQFVKRSKGELVVARKNLTALMYYRFVTKGGQRAKAAKRFLEVYKNGWPEQGNKTERQMVELAHFFKENKGWMHERIDAMPLFNRVMVAALKGNVLRYRAVEKKMADGTLKHSVSFAATK